MTSGLIKKIAINLVVSSAGASVLSVLMPIYNGVGLYEFFPLFFLFFIISTFYGDEPFNITKEWSKNAKTAKDFLGNIFYTILMLFGFTVVVILLYILINN